MTKKGNPRPLAGGAGAENDALANEAYDSPPKGPTRQSELLHTEQATLLAAEIIAAAPTYWKQNMDFSIIHGNEPLPFPIHWRYKNTSGVTFKKTDTAAAQAWIAAALF